MQQYNTQMPKVKLPEYGRNLQELVEYCKTIPDRDKRTRYAYGIVSIMGDLYPEAEKVENLRQILWDHLALISNYELDIDYPVEIIPKDRLSERPEKLENPQQQHIAWRMYGKVIEDMVAKACAIEDQDQRIRLFPASPTPTASSRTTSTRYSSTPPRNCRTTRNMTPPNS